VTDTNRRLLSYVLSAALLLALVAAVVVTVVGNQTSSAGGTTQESAAREDVQRVASSFAANVNTYSSDDIESYRKRVAPLLTPRFEGQFSKFLDSLIAQMRSEQLRSKGEVLVTGVSSVDADSATVLVVSDADVSSVGGQRARHFRWEVDLLRQDGRWLVNDFEPT
jgi:Mce-associated membrane protein